MKKKTILAASLAFALMASPLGGMNVSAEEGGDISAQTEASAAENQTLGTPYNVQFSEDLMWCNFSFPVTQYGRYMAHVKVYRDDEMVADYDTSWDNSSIWNINSKYTSGSYSWSTPFYQDLRDSGSYYFEVCMEKDLPSGLAVSQTASSQTVQYTRPEQALGTTTGYWDAEEKGLFHFTSVEGAAGYEYCLYKQNGSGWEPCILHSTSNALTRIGHTSAFSYITSDTPREAGGEDRIIDLSKDILDPYSGTPEGSYCVTIRALSGNPNEIANGEEGEKSDILLIGDVPGQDDSSDSEQDGSSDSGQDDSLSPLESRIEAAKPGDVIRMDGVNTLSCSEVRQLLDHGMTLEMEYTYEDVNYKVRIPAGASIDESIPWYGPLYLAQHYGVSRLSSPTAAAGGPSYTVQTGDTLGKIARANHMSLAELAAKNPQIKNVDVIFPGQAIQIK